MSSYAGRSGFQLLPFTISLIITLTIAAVAGFFTVPQIHVWYVYLQKPGFTPPNGLFGPVWTVLYIMIAISAYLVWKRRSDTVDYVSAKYIYLLQLLFNFSWSIVFFGLHQVFAALVVIIMLWVSIVINIFFFGKISKIAAWLLAPYLLWVSYASALNFAIYVLNKKN